MFRHVTALGPKIFMFIKTKTDTCKQTATIFLEQTNLHLRKWSRWQESFHERWRKYILRKRFITQNRKSDQKTPWGLTCWTPCTSQKSHMNTGTPTLDIEWLSKDIWRAKNPNRWWNIITPLKCGSNRRNTLSDSWKEQCSARQNFLRYIYVGNCLVSIPPIHPAHILSKKLIKGPIFKVGPNTY